MAKNTNMEITFEKQTKLYDSEKGIRGNCMVATYANVLGIEIYKCPAFEELFSCQYPTSFWFDAVNLWFENMGYKLIQANTQEEIPKDVEYYFAYGMSNRDAVHQVIYKDGKMFFDPHPDNTGILNEQGFEYIVKLNP